MSELRRVREEKKLSQAALAELAGTTQPQIQRLERGERKLTKEWAETLAPHLGLSPHELLFPPDRDGDFDRGPFDEEVRSLPEIPEGGIVEVDVRAGMGGGGEVQYAYVRDGAEITTVDAVKAEPWVLPRNFIREELRAPPSKLIILETQGESMLPTIAPGERVFVDTGHLMPSPDGLYALRDRFGLVVVKRLHVAHGRDNPRIHIISDNKSHTEEIVGMDEVQIVGKVVAGIKRY